MWFKSLLLLAVGCVTTVWGIEQMNSMEQVKQFLKDADEQTLVIWDIDQVLLQSTHPAISMNNLRAHKPLFKQIIKPLNRDEMAVMFALTTVHTDQQLLDPLIVNVLADLRERAIPHMALTASLTGPLAGVERLENQRIEQLGRLGISFADVAPLQGEHHFLQLPTYRGSPVLYKEGILFATGEKGPKGDSLVCFLAKCNALPEQIIFVDDRLHHVEDVEAKLAEKHPEICFVGIHFTGWEQAENKIITAEEFASVWFKLAEEASEIVRLTAEGGL